MIFFPVFFYLAIALSIYSLIIRKLFKYSVLRYYDLELQVLDEQFGKLKLLDCISRNSLVELLIDKASKTNNHEVLDVKIQIYGTTKKHKVAEHLTKSSFDIFNTVYENYRNGICIKSLADNSLIKSKSEEVEIQRLPTKQKIEKMVILIQRIVPLYLLLPILASILSLFNFTLTLSKTLAITSFFCLFPIIFGLGLWVQQSLGKFDVNFVTLLKNIPKSSTLLSALSILYFITLIYFDRSNFSSEAASIFQDQPEMRSIVVMSGMFFLFATVFLSTTLGQLKYSLSKQPNSN